MRFPFGILGGQIYISAIMNKIIKQEKQVYAMERKQVLLKKEQKDLQVKLMEIRCNLRKPEVTQVKLMEEFDLSRKQIQKIIKDLREEGLVERQGSNRNGRWVVKK